MHYFDVSGAVTSSSKRHPEPGPYLGTTTDFDANTLRFPKIVAGKMVLNAAAKTAWETREITALKKRLLRLANSEMIGRIGAATVNHGGKTYSVAKQGQVNGLATGESRGLVPAGGMKLTDTAGARIAITVTALDAIGQLMIDLIDTKNAEEAAHVSAIVGESSLAVLQSYDVTTGWT